MRYLERELSPAVSKLGLGTWQFGAREWGYGLTYASSNHRARALPHWLEHYNTRRPHSGIGNRPPLSRVHNLRGQDT